MLMKHPKDIHIATCSTLADKAVTGLFVLIVLLGSSLFLTGTAMAASLTPQTPLTTGYCDNPHPHCYAERYWSGKAGGASTLINPYGALRCYGCAGFIDDEMWFSDYSSKQCTSTVYGACWVEAGVSTWPANDPHSCNQGIDSTCGYWADNRPNPGGYNEWSLYNFGGDGVDLTPYLFYITIANDVGYSSSGSTWDVTTNIYKNGSWIAGPSGQSKMNSMSASRITIGSELSDSGGSADSIYLQLNQWESSNNGSWNYQTTQGTNDSTDEPPDGTWVTNPCSCTGNTGGSFETWDPV